VISDNICTISMLSRKYRLARNKDFARVSQQGKAIFGREISLKWTKNNLSYSRFGIVVSLKVDKKANVRNKIKRRIRAALKEYLVQLVQGYDFLILTRAEIKELDYSQIKDRMLKYFQKGKLIK